MTGSHAAHQASRTPLAVPDAARPAPTPAQAADETVTVPIALRVNGQARDVTSDIRSTLLDLLRDRIGLTGAKQGCDHGRCGACTVHLDGRRVLACLVLAVTARDRDVTTVEGLADGGRLHPVQRAFLDHDGLQCGFCTPGQIMSAVCAVADGETGSDAAIRETMAGNLCRCGAYEGILCAIREVTERQQTRRDGAV